MSVNPYEPLSSWRVRNRLLRDLWAFAGSVVWRWVALMGGLIMTAVYLFERWSKHEISPWLYWSLACFFIVVALFLALREDRRKWERLGGMAPLARTLKELVEPYHDRTPTRAKRLVEVYKGEWLKVTWPIKIVESNNPINWFRARKVSLHTPPDYPDVLLYFSRNRGGLFDERLDTGDHITVFGRILRIHKDQVILTACDVVDFELAKKKQEGDQPH